MLGSCSKRFSLGTERWKTVRRLVEGGNVILLIQVDDASAEAILDRRGILPYRFGHVRLERKILGEGQEPTPLPPANDATTTGKDVSRVVTRATSKTPAQTTLNDLLSRGKEKAKNKK